MTGEMAGRMRRFDWAATGLGTVENWSRTFRTALDLCLGSRARWLRALRVMS